MAGLDNNTLLNDFYQSPPEPTLPPVHPLVDLPKFYEEEGMARISLTMKKILFRGNELRRENDWIELAKNKKRLKELLILSNNGIKENRASKTRFYEIIIEEMKNRVRLERDIELSNIEVEDYKKVEQSMKYHVEKYSKFEKFLENVANVGDGYRNVRDILDKYESYSTTGQECARMLGTELEESLSLRKQMEEVMEDQSEKFKNLSNRLILLQVLRKDARDRRDFWEHMVTRIKNTVLDKTQEATTLSVGMFDLYCAMCKRRQVAAIIPKTNIEGQVNFITKTIMFYKEVITIATGSKIVQPVKEVREKKRRLKKRRTK